MSERGDPAEVAPTHAGRLIDEAKKWRRRVAQDARKRNLACQLRGERIERPLRPDAGCVPEATQTVAVVNPPERTTWNGEIHGRIGRGDLRGEGLESEPLALNRECFQYDGDG